MRDKIFHFARHLVLTYFVGCITYIAFDFDITEYVWSVILVGAICFAATAPYESTEKLSNKNDI